MKKIAVYILIIFTFCEGFGQSIQDSLLRAYGISEGDISSMNIINEQKTPQDSSESEDIFLIAKNTGDRILLRWAPAKPSVWLLGNKKGYEVEKMILSRGQKFEDAAFVSITPNPMKPWKVEKWASIASPGNTDNYPAIALQAIHGENKEADLSGEAMDAFLIQSVELKNRYSMALMAADLSADAATASGLRLEDVGIDTSKIYIYRVFVHSDSLSPHQYIAYAVVAGGNITPDAIPKIDTIREGERQVELLWEKDFHQQHFSAYYIEKSTDNGRSFFRINQIPFVSSTIRDDKEEFPNFSFLDTLQENCHPAQYRIVGISPFGELSLPSTPKTGMGRDKTPPPPPEDIKATYLPSGQMEVTWQFDKDISDLSGFYIGRSQNPLEGFELLTAENLPPTTRKFTDAKLDPTKTNYYIVGAIDTAGNASISPAVYGLIIDSIPPAAPMGLEGYIDTSGVVKLSWHLGKEQDIIGYQIYYANAENHVFTQLTNGPYRDTTFIDTISLRSLTEEIFFKVVAVDMSFNYSDFSDMLSLKKPDIVPPAAPVFKDYTIGDNYIYLSWAPSGSEDVQKHTLLRKSSAKERWNKIAEFTKTDPTSFRDSDLKYNEVYEYRIVAIDDAGHSSYAFPLRLKAPKNTSSVSPVESLFANFDKEKKQIHLSWEYHFDGDYRLVIYRSKEGVPLHAIKTIKKGEKGFTDYKIKTNTNYYTYRVKVTLPDGRESPLSKKVVIDLR